MTSPSQGGGEGTALAPALDELAVHGLTKRFLGTAALDDVELRVSRGTVHALLGGNGSGKSTLIKILAGVHVADSGTIALRESSWDAGSYDAVAGRAAGLRFVHQDLGMFPDLSIAENVALDAGYPTGPGARVSWRTLHRQTAALLERFEIDAEPRAPVSTLRPSDRTMLAIARALQDAEDGELILVLDEPTASLPEHESQLLLRAVRRRADQGQTILLVGHRLTEILSVADEITVLRDGRNAGTLSREAADEHAIISLIAGDTLAAVAALPSLPVDRSHGPRLTLSGVSAGPLRDIDLTVSSGEIVGVAGLLGAGRSSLLRTVFGDLPLAAGTISYDARPLPVGSPASAMGAGVAYVPEDRAGDAAFADMELRENVSAASFRQYWQGGVMRNRRERRDALDLLKRFGVKFSSPEAAFSSLSGGNQQKAILARWLRREPRVLLLDEPTQGVDVVARAEIYRLVKDAAAGGCAVLVVSSDFEELSTLCDRVVILQRGQLTGEVVGEDIAPPRLTELVQSDAVTKGTTT